MKKLENVDLPVSLTSSEAQDVEAKALQEGIAVGEFLGYCVRTVNFGIVYAAKMLSAQDELGHVGTDEGERG